MMKAIGRRFEKYANSADCSAVSNPKITMKSSTIEQLRAYLFIASVTAALIQVSVLLTMLVFRFPESVFMLPVFRLGMLALVVGTVLVVRARSRSAFTSAVASGHVSMSGWPRRTVSLSPQCPHRWLVSFHLRLNRRLSDRTLL
jgi:hypothetical protein